MASKKLDSRQRRFCEEYLKDLNGTDAAIRAGYSKRSASSIAYQLMQKPLVLELIKELQEKRSERTAVDADYVLRRLVEIDQMDFLDIMNNDLSLKPLHEWPKVWRQYLSSVELAELFEGRGDEREMVGVLKKIKWPDKVKNLELLGKHVSVNAFREQLDVNVNVSLAERMKKARERVSTKP